MLVSVIYHNAVQTNTLDKGRTVGNQDHYILKCSAVHVYIVDKGLHYDYRIDLLQFNNYIAYWDKGGTQRVPRPILH